MLKINRIETNGLLYYEALFNGGNLYTFTISELINQLATIYGFKTLLTEFNLNQNHYKLRKFPQKRIKNRKKLLPLQYQITN